MKIIFDSEKQMKSFVKHNCPWLYGYKRSERCDDRNFSCRECFQEHIEMEIKKNE